MGNKENNEKISNTQEDWNKVVKDFGKVVAPATLEYTFVYTGDWKYLGHSSSCGCTTGKWEDGKLTAKFTVKNKLINQHMREAGKYFTNTSKNITVVFKKDGETKKDVLTLQAEVHASDIKF